jgi:pSer/pThr/pTyr-binding forkhead associated (FHA) protein
MNATLIEPIYLIQNNNQRFFSYTIFPVNKINVEKILKITRKLLFNYSFYSHPKIGKFQGVTIYPLNRISSRDSKKEETKRREINKNITIGVGRWPSSFVIWV